MQTKENWEVEFDEQWLKERDLILQEMKGLGMSESLLDILKETLNLQALGGRQKAFISARSSSLHRDILEKLEGKKTSTPFGTVERPSDYNSGLNTAIKISNQVFGRTE